MNAISHSSSVGITQVYDNPNSKETIDEKGEKWTGQSVYVEIFQEMIVIVMKQEKFLFTLEEQAYIHNFETLSYPARYLLIRLCLCKRGKWHSLVSLEQRYKKEIGGKDLISRAIDELCGIAKEVPVKIEDAKHEIVDLTLDDDEDSNMTFKGNFTASRSASLQRSLDDQSSIFAEDDASAPLPELLDCLTFEELKCVGKQMKLTKAGQNRSTLLDAILSGAANQSILCFPFLAPYNKTVKAKGKPLCYLPSSPFKEDGMGTQAAVVRQLVSGTIGRCVRITPTIFALFDRLNIVFFRSTTHESSLLLPAILSAFRKRHHFKTDYVRTANIFPSRQALLDYEEALALEVRVEEALSGNTFPVANLTRKSSRVTQSRSMTDEGALSKLNPRVEGAKVVRQIWTEVYDRWKVLVASQDEDGEKPLGLERFNCGHVLTRIVHKGAEALAILREHDLEMGVLRALLAQHKWGRGRRGAWYDRLALVLMTHSEKTTRNWEAAMNIVIRGLQDSLTHLVYRPRLQRRLTRLEKRLKISSDYRHKCNAQLRNPQIVYVEGIRSRHKADSSGVDIPTRGPIVPSSNEHADYEIVPTKFGKSLWIGEGGEAIAVEQFALEYYQKLGYKGFHSEGRIVSTIFGLLFWDIIFASIPGAFETPYQSAPLDILEDSFYLARQDLIDKRLARLENGEAHQLLEEVLEREMPYRTLCIGVDWTFAREDLLEIVESLGSHALAIICQMMCEKYGQWRSGVPDLLVWKADTRQCRFVEVKSPNDSLQENQKVWIDVLLNSGVAVDLCRVTEKGEAGQTKTGFKRASHRSKTRPISYVEIEDNDTHQQTPLQREGTREGKRTRDPEDHDFPSMKMRKTN